MCRGTNHCLLNIIGEVVIVLFLFSGLLGCDTLSLGEWFVTIERTVVPLSSTVKTSLKNSSVTSLPRSLEDEKSQPRRLNSIQLN